MIIRCNGKSALNASLHPTWDVRMSDKQHDILQCTFKACSRLPPGVTLHKQWVKGHADNNLPYNRMTWTQQLNVDCDRGAGDLARMPIPPDRPREVSGGAWVVKIQGTRLVNDLDATLRKWIHDPEALALWDTENHLQETCHHLINWTAFKKATKTAPKRRTIGITKLFSGECATNQKMVEWGFRATTQCPRCNHPTEDVPCILWCSRNNAVAIWDESLANLNNWLESQGTANYQWVLIYNRLKAWKRGEEWRLNGVPLIIRQLQEEQQSIG